MNTNAIYQQVLKQDFDKLPPAVAAFHRRLGISSYSGEVEVFSPQSLLARIAASLLGTPTKAGRGPIQFELLSTLEREQWTRNFFGTTMMSTLTVENGQLIEQLGLAKLRFELRADETKLSMKLVAISVFGIPCPRWLLPQIIAEETQENQRFCFRVSAHLPVLGRVVAYSGFLELVGERAQ